MPGSHWMITTTAENYSRCLQRGLTVIGLRARHRKKAERMLPGDRVVVFVSGRDTFPATATVAAPYFEDHSPIWINRESRPDDFPWRIRVKPSIILDRDDEVNAHQIAPRMLYVKRWPPEQWPLAFQGQVHLLSQQDFRMVEIEMERILEQRERRARGGRLERPQPRPAEQVEAQKAPGV